MVARGRVDLDITWLKDDSLEDPDSLTEPAVLIAEIHEERRAIVRQFADIAAGLGADPPRPGCLTWFAARPDRRGPSAGTWCRAAGRRTRRSRSGSSARCRRMTAAAAHPNQVQLTERNKPKARRYLSGGRDFYQSVWSLKSTQTPK